MWGSTLLNQLDAPPYKPILATGIRTGRSLQVKSSITDGNVLTHGYSRTQEPFRLRCCDYIFFVRRLSGGPPLVDHGTSTIPPLPYQMVSTMSVVFASWD